MDTKDTAKEETKEETKETTHVVALRLKESTYNQLKHMADYLGLSVNKVGSCLLEVGVKLGVSDEQF